MAKPVVDKNDCTDLVGAVTADKPVKSRKGIGGAPSIYTPELAERICDQLACGVPLVKICRQEGMPSYSAVRKWEKTNPEFAALSARAKADGTHFLADDALMIADEPLPTDPDAARTEINRRKLQIDTRMRLIGKWNSRAYGDKALLGSDPDNPLPEHTVKIDVAGIADQLRRQKALPPGD